MNRSLRHSSRLVGATLLAGLLLASAPADAQMGRVFGSVRDAETGEPIRGATVVAENPQGNPGSLTSVSDAKGRFTMIGLRSGVWRLVASAPGYSPSGGMARVQSFGVNPPFEFKLPRAPVVQPGPLDGVDVAAIQEELNSADRLMDEAKFDAAIAAYAAIGQRVPALTSVHLQIGRAHALKKDYAAAVTALERVPDTDPLRAVAREELGRVYLAAGQYDAAERELLPLASVESPAPGATLVLAEVKLARSERSEAARWLQKTIDTAPDAPEAARARDLLAAMRR